MVDRMDEGTYYIGDLCYVLNDTQWSEVCDLMHPYGNESPNRNKSVHGKFFLSDGTVISIYGTAYGDGRYVDRKDQEYWVDSGTIGCVSTKHLPRKFKKKTPNAGSHLHTFHYTFDTHYEDGVITFGHVQINTSESDW